MVEEPWGKKRQNKKRKECKRKGWNIIRKTNEDLTKKFKNNKTE